MRKRLVTIGALAIVVVVVAAAVVIGLRWWRDSQRTDLQRAFAMAPGSAERFSWTDWAGVRAELDADLDSRSSAQDLTAFLDAGFEADLTSTSAMGGSAATLQTEYGFSPATVDWELFSQGAEGAQVLLGMPESADFEALADTLRELGYAEPETDDGVWTGGDDLLAGIGGINPEFGYVALDAEAGVIRAGDGQAYLERAGDDVLGEDLSSEALDDVVGDTGAPLSAAVYTGDRACAALAMNQADERDQDEAAQLVEAAGEVNPLTAFAMSVQPDLDVRVTMAFETDEQARENADSRARLASGPAPGQGGDFADRFELGPVTAEGRVVRMDLVPVEGAYVLSDLSTGPLVFATC